MIYQAWIRRLQVGRGLSSTFDSLTCGRLHECIGTPTLSIVQFFYLHGDRNGAAQRTYFSTKSLASRHPSKDSQSCQVDALSSVFRVAVRDNLKGLNLDDIDVSKQTTTMGCFLAPYQGVQDDTICSAPYDYTASLTGKNSISKYISALEGWFDVPTSSVEIIKKVASDMVNISLM